MVEESEALQGLDPRVKDAIVTIAGINSGKNQNIPPNIWEDLADERRALANAEGQKTPPGAHLPSKIAVDLIKNIEVYFETGGKLTTGIVSAVSTLAKLKPGDDLNQVLEHMRQGAAQLSAKSGGASDPKHVGHYDRESDPFLIAYRKLQIALNEGVDYAIKPTPANTTAVASTADERGAPAKH